MALNSGLLLTVFVNPNDASQVVLDKRDTNFLDAMGEVFCHAIFADTGARMTLEEKALR